MRTNNKRGISLIVLVITIIVMIILAAAIILSLNNSGIIDKANKAKQDSDVANLKEYVNVLKAEWELMDADERAGKTSTEYVNDKLKDKHPDAALSVDGKVYSGLNVEVRKAVAGGIQIGDTVTGYTLDSSKSSTTTSGKENTASNIETASKVEPVNTPQTVNQTSYTTWKYIGISEKGQLLIAPDIPTTGTVNTMKLSGKGAYLMGPIELDNVCNALYSTDKGIARSMNVEDVNRILNYTGPKGSYTDAVGNIVDTIEPKTVGEIEKDLNVTIRSRITPEDNKTLEEYKSEKYETIKVRDEISVKADLKDFVLTTKEYWLASRYSYASVFGGYVSFGVLFVGVEKHCVTSGVGVYSSFDTSVCGISAVRPVVQINSDVSVSYNSSTHTLNLN